MPETKVYIGNPCKYGHSGIRYISNKGCVQCQREKEAKQAEWKASYNRAYWLRIKDDPEQKQKNCVRVRRYRLNHPEAPAKAEKRRLHREAVNRNTLLALRAEGVCL